MCFARNLVFLACILQSGVLEMLGTGIFTYADDSPIFLGNLRKIHKPPIFRSRLPWRGSDVRSLVIRDHGSLQCHPGATAFAIKEGLARGQPPLLSRPLENMQNSEVGICINHLT